MTATVITLTSLKWQNGDEQNGKFVLLWKERRCFVEKQWWNMAEMTEIAEVSIWKGR